MVSKLSASLLLGGLILSVLAATPPAAAAFSLSVTAPLDSQKFETPLIPIAGKTRPGALIEVSGIKLAVDSSGAFCGKIPIPDEKGILDMTITASLNGQKQAITRRIQYAPALALILRTPREGQVISDTQVTLTGEVIPEKAILTVNDKKITITPSGSFSSTYAIPDKEQEIRLVCVVKLGLKSVTIQRTIVYKRAGSDAVPVIQPTSLPAVTQQNRLIFSVMDRSPNEEITFYREIDGAAESEVGQANGQFTMPVEEGIHSYAVYAEDKAKNRTKRVSGEIKYLSRPLTIKVRHPLASERLGPGSEEGPATTTVSFAVENLPGDNPKLLKEVTVTNSAKGVVASQHDPVSLDFEFEAEIDRTKQNVFTIAVRDINDRIFTAQATIRTR
jgi:hypothetical protein